MLRAGLILLVAFFVVSGCETGDYSTGSETMVRQFESSCRTSVGNWTNTALQQTQALIATLQTIKDKQKESCAGVTAALQATQDLHLRLSQVINDPHLKAYRAAEEKKLEVMLAINRAQAGGGTDQSLMDLLRGELYQTELEIVRTRANASVVQGDQSRNALIESLGDLNQHVVQLMSEGNLSACFAAAPHAPLGIASSLLAVGGNFATPMMGAGLASLGQLMSTTVNYLKQFNLDQIQLDLESPRMQVAVTCSMEAMSNLYCDAENSYQFMQYALRSYGANGRVSGVWKGMDLLGRRVPVLNRWLMKVSSGVPPSDDFSAKRLNEIWEKQSKLRQIRNLVVGELNKAKRLLGSAGNPTERDRLQATAFRKIIKHMYSSRSSYSFDAPPSPIEEAMSAGKAICLLSADVPCKPPENQFDVDNFIDAHPIANADFAGFSARVEDLFREVQLLVEKELHSTINHDPDRLVAEAIEPTMDNWPVVKVLRELAQFSTEYANSLRQIPVSAKPGRDRTIAMAEDSARSFREVADLIESSTSSVDVIKAVFERFKLLEGIQFVNERVTQMVGWELEARVSSGQLPPDLSDDLLAAGISLVSQLERSGLNVERDADRIRDDILQAQDISTQNMRMTADAFAGTIAQLLVKMKQRAYDAGETKADDPATHGLAKMCLLLLTTSMKWPEKVDFNICRGTKLVSSYPNSNLSLSFDAVVERMSNPSKPLAYKDRVCIYSNFLRSSRLFRLGTAPTVQMIPVMSGLEKEKTRGKTPELLPIDKREMARQILGPSVAP